MKGKSKEGTCQSCGRENIKYANIALRLCRRCHYRRWAEAHPKSMYREATATERALLDDAKTKLVIAFLKGDVHTQQRADEVLRNLLKQLRT